LRVNNQSKKLYGRKEASNSRKKSLLAIFSQIILSHQNEDLSDIFGDDIC
jgi:hypothetical protein